MELVHPNVRRRIVAKHIQRVQAEVKSIAASAYITRFLIIFPLFILESPACHIRIETLISLYLTELFRHCDIIRKFRPKNHVCHIIRVESCYSCADGGKKKLFLRMLSRIMPQVGKSVHQLLFCHFLHVLIQGRDSIRLPLYSFGLSHDCSEFFHRQPCSSSGMVAVHIAAEYEHLIFAKFLNVFRGNSLFHDYVVLVLIFKQKLSHALIYSANPPRRFFWKASVKHRAFPASFKRPIVVKQSCAYHRVSLNFHCLITGLLKTVVYHQSLLHLQYFQHLIVLLQVRQMR